MQWKRKVKNKRGSIVQICVMKPSKEKYTKLNVHIFHDSFI